MSGSAHVTILYNRPNDTPLFETDKMYKCGKKLSYYTNKDFFHTRENIPYYT